MARRPGLYPLDRGRTRPAAPRVVLPMALSLSPPAPLPLLHAPEPWSTEPVPAVKRRGVALFGVS